MPLTDLTRRELLKAAGLATVAAACGPATPPDDPTPDVGLCPAPPLEGTPHPDPAALPLSTESFPFGVMSGSADGTRAVFTAISAGLASARLMVLRGEGADTRLVADVEVLPNDGGYLKASVEGLSPGAKYRYAFTNAEGTQRSEVGQLKTPFATGCRAPVRFAATTCTKVHPYDSLKIAAGYELDAFVHLGDMSYNDGATTLAEFREKWKASIDDAGYRAILPKAPLYITWDDHEFRNNTEWASATPEALAAFKAAFFELLPTEPGPDGRLWRSHRFGDTVELFVLDSRSERKPDTRTTPDAEYLSNAQLEWLIEGLKKSTAHFKVLMSSVPIANFPDSWLTEGDRWEGYAAQREKLLGAIEQHGIRNVWSLSGDFHVGAVLRFEREGARSRMWDILVGPGANGPNPLELAYRFSPQNAEEIAPADQFKYFSGEFAATLLDFDPAADEVRVRFLSAKDGSTLFDEKLKQG